LTPLQERALRIEMVRICRRLYNKGLLAGADGNVSIRFPDSRCFLTTPSGVHKGSLCAGDLVLVGAAGEVIGGMGRPSSELALHLSVYREDPACMAVVHTHAPWAMALSLAGLGLAPHLLVEARMLLGTVAVVPYREPGSIALAEAVAAVLHLGPAQILAHHGALTRGPSLAAAADLMECLEHNSKITALARLLGDPAPLPPP